MAHAGRFERCFNVATVETPLLSAKGKHDSMCQYVSMSISLLVASVHCMLFGFQVAAAQLCYVVAGGGLHWAPEPGELGGQLCLVGAGANRMFNVRC